MNQSLAEITEQLDDRVVLPVLFVAAVTIRLAYWLRVGTYYPPATEIFLKACNAPGLSFWTRAPRQILKIGYIAPQCFVVDTLGLPVDTWIVVQAVVSALTCVVVYVTAKQVISRVGAVVSGLLMLFAYDAFIWINSPTTETLFVFAVALAMLLLCRFYSNPTPERRVGAWLGLGFVFFTRPHGFGMVGAWLAFDYLRNYRSKRDSLVPASRVGTVAYHVVAAVGFVGILGLFVRASFANGAYHPWVEGWVLDHGIQTFPIAQIEYTPEPADNMIMFAILNADVLILLAVLRFVAFFYPYISFAWWGPRWQLFHNLTLWPLLGGGVAGIVLALRNRDERLVHLGLLPLLGLLAIISLTYLDRNWRYRAPANPIFALFAGYFVDTYWPIVSARIRQLPGIDSE